MIRAFPFRRLKCIQSPKGENLYTVTPIQLHIAEGKEANIERFRTWIRYVGHYYDIPNMRLTNLHVYTANCYEELPLEVSLDDILKGKYGRMDERNPLRVVYIPGKWKRQVFP